jgi:serine/threonine protein kinase
MAAGPLPPGTKLGSYQLVRLLGEGGMGTVYEATHRQLGKKVALKTLLPALVGNDEAARRFVREARSSALIDHPNVVKVTDFGTADGMAFMVMEFLEGESLSDRLAREGRLDVHQALDQLLPIMDGLAAGHDRGVVHRDFKPSNDYLTGRLHGGLDPKLLDFGISKILDNEETRVLTMSGAMLGTPQYMAPEQVEGAGRADARADQYAAGLVLWECLAGRPARTGGSPFEMLASIGTTPIPSISSVLAGINPRLDQAVSRALAPTPDERFEDMPAFMRALVPHARSETRAIWAESLVRKAPTSRR